MEWHIANGVPRIDPSSQFNREAARIKYHLNMIHAKQLAKLEQRDIMQTLRGEYTFGTKQR